MYSEELITNRLRKGYDEQRLKKEMLEEELEHWLKGKFTKSDHPTNLLAFLEGKLTVEKTSAYREKITRYTFKGYPEFYIANNNLYSTTLDHQVCSTENIDCQSAYNTILEQHKFMKATRRNIATIIERCKTKICSPDQQLKLDNVSSKIFEALAESELRIEGEHKWVHHSDNSALTYKQMNYATGKMEETTIVINHEPYLIKIQQTR